MKRLRLLTLVLSLAATSALAADANRHPPDEVIPLITMDSVPLEDVIKSLARQARTNYILDPAALKWISDTRPQVNARWTNVTALTALQQVVAIYHLVTVTNPVTCVARIVRRGQEIRPVTEDELGDDHGKKIPLISIEGVPLAEVIKSLARKDQLNYEIDPKVDLNALGADNRWGPGVDLRLENVTARQALVALLDNYGLALVQTAGEPAAKIVQKRTLKDDPKTDK